MRHILSEKYELDEADQELKTKTISALQTVQQALTQLLQNNKEDQANIKKAQQKQLNTEAEKATANILNGVSADITAGTGVQQAKESNPSVTDKLGTEEKSTTSTVEDLIEKQTYANEAMSIVMKTIGAVQQSNTDSPIVSAKLNIIIKNCNKINFASTKLALQDFCNQMKKLDNSGAK